MQCSTAVAWSQTALRVHMLVQKDRSTCTDKLPACYSSMYGLDALDCRQLVLQRSRPILEIILLSF